MNVFQHLQAVLNAGVGRGYKFEQGLGKISGDVRICERGPQSFRMLARGDVPCRCHPQAFLFNPAPNIAPGRFEFGYAVSIEAGLNWV